jgi:hypothetical protein
MSADRTAGQYWWLPEMSADRIAGQYWGLTEMSLLTGPLDNTGGCQRCLLTGNQPILEAAERCLLDKLGVIPSHYHHTMVHIANRPGMEKRPVEAAVLRRHSRPIIANLPIYTASAILRSFLSMRGQGSLDHGATIVSQSICQLVSQLVSEFVN